MNKRLFTSFVGFFIVCCLFLYLYQSSDAQIAPSVPNKEKRPLPSPITPIRAVPLPPSSDSPINVPIGAATPPNAAERSYGYINEFNGRLAVFADIHSPIPDIVTDITLSILPEADRQIIRQGFFVYSEAELSKLLEDLGS